jgi:Uma2 family endonuclease
MTAQRRRAYTSDEYLARERTSNQKSEYYAGEIYGLAGGTEQHNLISGNVYASFHAQLRRRQCTVYPSDMRVYIQQTGLYTYPDVSVTCGPAQFQDPHRDTLLNPTVIVEVLSPSTENYDRGKKFQNYRTLDSLQEYIVIAQDSHHIEHYVRQPNNQWLLEEFDELDAVLSIAAIDCTLAIQDVYEKVVFAEPDEDTF